MLHSGSATARACSTLVTTSSYVLAVLRLCKSFKCWIFASDLHSVRRSSRHDEYVSYTWPFGTSELVFLLLRSPKRPLGPKPPSMNRGLEVVPATKICQAVRCSRTSKSSYIESTPRGPPAAMQGAAPRGASIEDITRLRVHASPASLGWRYKPDMHRCRAVRLSSDRGVTIKIKKFSARVAALLGLPLR